ncbi:hypothetical protein DMR_37020 [Solidesulfovibrio magneticus RS-1]|uniref:Uncharacterized protein n=1 Tax=Solidesulfovibrio magneticus (strain ATCC 700980 / DSM 13731 / RS-1) TaxID=573370 RepID=C4XM65_SOLM1|nr:hypothetical protein DMR_37020 [Solidesulfovibrio magneticus RS-1]
MSKNTKENLGDRYLPNVLCICDIVFYPSSFRVTFPLLLAEYFSLPEIDAIPLDLQSAGLKSISCSCWVLGKILILTLEEIYD